MSPTEGENKDTIKKYLRLKDVKFNSTYYDKDTKTTYNIVDFEPLIDYLGEKFKELKAEIFYVSDLSPEGH